MAGAEKAWDRLKQSEEKKKKQQEAVKNAKYQPAKKQEKKETPNGYRVRNSYDEETLDMKRSSAHQKTEESKRQKELKAMNNRANAARNAGSMYGAKTSTTRGHYTGPAPSDTSKRDDWNRKNVPGYERRKKEEENNRKKLEKAFEEEKNGGKKVRLRNLNMMKKYGR